MEQNKEQMQEKGYPLFSCIRFLQGQINFP